MAFATYRLPHQIGRGLVAHVAAVATLTVALLATNAPTPAASAAIFLPLTLAGAPWSLLPWLMVFALGYQGGQGIYLMLVAAAALNVGLHFSGAGSWVVRRPPLLIAALAASALAISVPLAAFATFLGTGPTATLLILVGGPFVLLSVAAAIGRHLSSPSSSS